MASGSGDFWTKYEDFDKKVRELYLMFSTDENKETIARNSLNMNEFFQDPAFPKTVREQVKAEFQNLIGFHQALDKDFVDGKLIDNPAGIRWIDDVGQTLAKFREVDLSDPRAALRSVLSLQYDPDRIPEFGQPTGKFTIGGNIPTHAWAKNIGDTLSGKSINLKAGESLLIFDTETMGLSSDLAGIRQVAGSVMDVQAGGTLTFSGQSFDAEFTTARGSLGKIYDSARGMPVRINDFLSGTNTRAALTGAGDDLVDQLIPFLEQAQKSDYFVGHNIRFDIDQVLGNLEKTRMYKDNVDYRGHKIGDLIDSVRGRMDPLSGRVVDTQLLLQKKLANSIQLAPELLMRNEKRAFSLENAVLQTNLVQLMEADMAKSGETVDQFFLGSGGQHTADFDTRLTGYLFKFLKSGQLQAGQLGGSDLYKSIRAATLKSYAVTPVSNIADVRHIDPRLFSEIISGTDGGIRVMEVGTGNLLVDPKATLGVATDDELYDALTKSKDYVVSAKLTPLEQEIWQGRQASGIGVGGINANPTVDEIIQGLGRWSPFSGIDRPYQGMLNKVSTLFKMGNRPSDQDFLSLQRSYAAAGNPFADLETPERILTHALAGVTSEASVLKTRLDALPGERFLADIGQDLGITRFAAQDEFFVGKSKKVSIPLQVMHLAEEEGILKSNFARKAGEAPTMLGLSAFDFDQVGGDGQVRHMFNVGLAYNFTDQAEAKNFADWIVGLDPSRKIGDETLEAMGLTAANRDSFVDAIRAGGLENGVTVGRLDGEAGRKAYMAIADLFQNLVRDKDKIPMAVAYMGEEGGVIRAGATMLNRFMSPSDKLGIGQRLTMAEGVLGKLEALTPSQRRVAQSIAGTGLKASNVSTIVDGYRNFVRTKLPIAGAALAVGAGILLLRNRRQEEDFYGEPLEPMETEGYIPRPEFQEAYTGQDPLATAGVSGNMDRMKTNHTVMNTSKYSHLFGGALG